MMGLIGRKVGMTQLFDEKGDVRGRERNFIVLIVKDGRFTSYWAPRR